MRYSPQFVLAGTILAYSMCIGGAVASETTGTISQPGSVSTGITGTVATPTPTPTPTPAPSGGGGGGGGGGGFVASTPTPTPSSLFARIDTNHDGRIDILDFNTLMVHWGETGSNNIADFDQNGIVDIFDFNLMMVNWTN